MEVLLVILAGWAAYYTLWMLFARKVNLVKLTNPLPFREGLVWTVTWLLSVPLWFAAETVWKADWPYVFGFYAAFAFAIFVRLQLGTNWKPFAAQEANYTLITTGPYRYLRHPLYFAQFLMCIFTAMACQKLVPAILFVCLPAIANRLRAQSERDLLLKLFPEKYSAYRNGTFWGIVWQVRGLMPRS